MNELLNRLVARGFQDMIWGGDLVGDELPERGPAVIVSNHLGALGPIAVGASVPLRMHFWMHADMLDPRLAPDYLCRDFVEPQLHIPAPASVWLAKIIAKIHVPLLKAVGGIPVYSSPEGYLETFCISVELLLRENFLLIFPEDPNLPLNPLYQMAPFKKGFARLGELFYARTHSSLPFYPVAVHAETRTVRVGKPVRYSYLNLVALERQRIKNLLEQSIRAMYIQSSSEIVFRQPLTN